MKMKTETTGNWRWWVAMIFWWPFGFLCGIIQKTVEKIGIFFQNFGFRVESFAVYRLEDFFTWLLQFDRVQKWVFEKYKKPVDKTDFGLDEFEEGFEFKDEGNHGNE